MGRALVLSWSFTLLPAPEREGVMLIWRVCVCLTWSVMLTWERWCVVNLVTGVVNINLRGGVVNLLFST